VHAARSDVRAAPTTIEAAAYELRVGEVTIRASVSTVGADSQQAVGVGLTSECLTGGGQDGGTKRARQTLSSAT
jgi:hypothetical protein